MFIEIIYKHWLLSVINCKKTSFIMMTDYILLQTAKRRSVKMYTWV